MAYSHRLVAFAGAVCCPRIPSGYPSVRRKVRFVRPLKLWESYTRREVHDIFDPDTTFTPQTGTWGISGIVRVPNRQADFVFFVTFGKTQGTHVFDEGITEDGVLTWQSQPRQGLATPMIRRFIEHDERVDAIHLFLRTKAAEAYTYFGELGYLSHDLSRENPVHLQWQLMSWPAPPERLAALNIDLDPRSEPPDNGGGQLLPSASLTRVAVPRRRAPGGRDSSAFRRAKQVTRPDQDARNAKLGLAGEILVLDYEIGRLRSADRSDLADRVRHVSVLEGDSAGYDIRSFDVDGSERYLEVKTTRGSATAAFFVSPNQVAVSRRHPTRFVLVRVFDFNQEYQAGRFFELRGPLDDHLDLEPSEFRAMLTRPDTEEPFDESADPNG